MKRLRKIIFWCHLPVGILSGIVILIMCVTGTLLSFERQITAWADTKGYVVNAPANESRKPVETLITSAMVGRQSPPTSVTLRADKTAPAEISFGREATVFVNPYSGEVMGEGSRAVRNFFRRITDWHRWLGAQGDNRSWARSITGICNLAFLFMVMSGFYLWWPQKWSRKLVRNVTWFKKGLPAKARDFNWHNVIGFWMAVPLFIIVLSGVVISFTWASDLVYRIAGETPPPQRAQPPSNAGSDRRKQQPDSVVFTAIDPLWARAEQRLTDWQSITLQLPSTAEAPLTFTIDQGNGGQPQKRSQLTLDRKSGDTVRWEPFTNNSPGRKLRSILRFSHTGEVLGIAGQILACVATTGGAVLVWTGFALAWRRLRAWQGRRAKSREVTQPAPVEIPSEPSW